MSELIANISVEFEHLWLKQKLPFSAREIKLLLETMQSKLSKTNQGFTTQIECFFVGDAQIEDLNQSYLNSPGPTNTLAFEAKQINIQTNNDVAYPAKIFFSVTQYEREYLLYGQPREEYAIFLLAHAMTHLIGLEHGPKMDLVSEKLQEVSLKEHKSQWLKLN